MNTLETVLLCVYTDYSNALTKRNTLTEVMELETWSKNAYHNGCA